jgi:ankyrin repeat protein
MNAVQGKSEAKVRFLLDRGADVNAVDHRGFTALHRAAEMGQAAVVRLLLERVARPDPEAQGQTPRSLAAARAETAIVEVLDSWARG